MKYIVMVPTIEIIVKMLTYLGMEIWNKYDTGGRIWL